MKLLGKYKRVVAICYQKLLEENQIVVEIENMTNPYFRMFRWSDYNLLVRDEDQEKASELVNQFENQAKVRVEELDKQIQPVLKIVLLIVGTIISFYIFSSR
jgi:hypothetical protein